MLLFGKEMSEEIIASEEVIKDKEEKVNDVSQEVTVNGGENYTEVQNNSIMNKSGRTSPPLSPHSANLILRSENLQEVIFQLVNAKSDEASPSCGDKAIEQLARILSEQEDRKLLEVQKIYDSSMQASHQTFNSGNIPIIPINDIRGEEATGYSRNEKQIRCKLAALYRLMEMNGWTTSIYNHITVRLQTGVDEFLINPFGLLYHEITASSLVKISLSGEVKDKGSTQFGIDQSGWALHSAIHSARPDVFCVLHIHLPDVIAVSCLKSGLEPISPEAVQLLSRDKKSQISGVTYCDFQQVASGDCSTLKDGLAENNKLVFLRNQGVAVCASTLEEAWFLTQKTIIACKTQMRLLQLGGGKLMNGGTTASKTLPRGVYTEYSGPEGSVSMGRGELEFEAMMRLLDNAGYKTGYNYKQPHLLRKGISQVTGSAGYSAPDATMAGVPEINIDRPSNDTMARVTDQVKNNKQKCVQRNQWLVKTMSPETDTLTRQTVPEVESSLPAKSATLAISVDSSRVHAGKDSNLHSPKSLSMAASPSAEDNMLRSGTETDAQTGFSSGDELNGEKKKKKKKRFRTPSFLKRKKQ